MRITDKEVILNRKEMDFVNRYFAGLLFTQVDEKQGYVIYGAGIHSGLGGGLARYILAFVPSHLAFKKQANLRELAWQNLQAREIQQSYNLKKQRWVLKRDAPDLRLTVVKRTPGYTIFQSMDTDFPFEIHLLHSPKKKTKYQYNNSIMLTAAIDSFQLVMNYTGDSHPFLQQASQPLQSLPSQKKMFSGWFQVPESVDDSFELI